MNFEGGKIRESAFRPAVGLSNLHLQTLWSTMFRPPLFLKTQPETLEMADGDFINLFWYSRQHEPLVVLLHGLASSAQAKYIQGLQWSLSQKGFASVAMNLRGSGTESNRLARSYHGGVSSDLNTIFWNLRERNPRRPIAVVGVSLGANILLKWLGEEAKHVDPFAAVAVSPPFLLNQATDKLSRGFAKVYGQYLLSGMKQQLLCKVDYLKKNGPPEEFEKLSAVLEKANWSSINSIKNIFDFDDKITAPLHGFRSAQHYYQESSARHYLKQIQAPTLLIHAKDDPFIPVSAIPSENELSPSTMLELAERGGHVGFVTGGGSRSLEYWLERRIPEFLLQRLR